MQGANGIGKDKCGKDIEWSLFGHPEQRRQHDFLRLFLDDLNNRGFLDSAGIQELPKHRRLEDVKTNPQANPNEYDRERKRDSPAPRGELIA